MGSYEDQLRAEHRARRARLGLDSPRPAVSIAPRPALVEVPKPASWPQLNPLTETVFLGVCRHFDIALGSLRSNRRYDFVVEARHVAIYLLRQYWGWKHSAIADIFQMDPSSMLYPIQQVETTPRLQMAALEIYRRLPPNVRATSKDSEELPVNVSSKNEDNAKPVSTIDWKVVAERLARENERLRTALMACRTIAESRSRIIMADGTAMQDYIRQALAAGEGTEGLKFNPKEASGGGNTSHDIGRRDASVPGAPQPQG